MLAPYAALVACIRSIERPSRPVVSPSLLRPSCCYLAYQFAAACVRLCIENRRSKKIDGASPVVSIYIKIGAALFFIHLDCQRRACSSCWCHTKLSRTPRQEEEGSPTALTTNVNGSLSGVGVGQPGRHFLDLIGRPAPSTQSIDQCDPSRTLNAVPIDRQRAFWPSKDA